MKINFGGWVQTLGMGIEGQMLGTDVAGRALGRTLGTGIEDRHCAMGVAGRTL